MLRVDNDYSGDPQCFSTVRYKIVRGALDFGGVVGRMKARSKYGGAQVDLSMGIIIQDAYSQEAKEINLDDTALLRFFFLHRSNDTIKSTVCACFVRIQVFDTLRVQAQEFRLSINPNFVYAFRSVFLNSFQESQSARRHPRSSKQYSLSAALVRPGCPSPNSSQSQSRSASASSTWSGTPDWSPTRPT